MIGLSSGSCLGAGLVSLLSVPHRETTMRRMHLAMALGLGLGWVAGCGPTASEPGDNNPTPAPVAAPGDAGKGGGPGGGGGMSGAGGPPANVAKGMDSEAYRNMPGSKVPGGDAPKPA